MREKGEKKGRERWREGGREGERPLRGSTSLFCIRPRSVGEREKEKGEWKERVKQRKRLPLAQRRWTHKTEGISSSLSLLLLHLPPKLNPHHGCHVEVGEIHQIDNVRPQHTPSLLHRDCADVRRKERGGVL